MTRLFIGNKPGVGGVVKVMRNDADNPLTVPNTAYEKYLFNSETQDLGYVRDIFAAPYDPVTWPPPTGSGSGLNSYFDPPGSTKTNAHIYIENWQQSSGDIEQDQVYILKRLYADMDFEPLMEFRARTRGTNTFAGPTVKYVETDTGDFGRETGHHEGGTGFIGNYSKTIDLWVGNQQARETYTPGGWTTKITVRKDTPLDYVCGAWELPIENVPLAPPVGTPTAGQKNVQITPSIVRIARPGFDVGSATGRRLILDSTRIPAKIIAAGEVTIAANSTATVNSRFPLTPETYLDFHICRVGDLMCQPAFLPSGTAKDKQLNFSYTVNAASVTLINGGDDALIVRYMLLADDASAPSTGGSKVMFRSNDGVSDFLQIKRPGSSDVSTKLNDIMLDTRLSSLQLVAEGYLGVAAFTESPTSAAYGSVAKTISFANSGFKPFVKYTVVFPDEVRQPITRLLRSFLVSGFNNVQANIGSVAIINDTSVKFHLAPGNPTSLRLDANNQVEARYTQPDPIGIRYYIFALPTSF